MATIPAIDEVIRATLDQIRSLNLRPGHIFPILPVSLALQKAGYTEDERKAAFAKMAEDGWLTFDGSPHAKLTEAGYAAL